MKIIFHLDLDSYFVSAERTIDHSLKGKPVMISTGERRSIASAVSYEAKAKGVYVPMPYYKAVELIPDIIAVEPNFALYTSLSGKVFNLINDKFTDKVEVASIDECYIDVTDIWKEYGSPVALAKAIQKMILMELDLPCSIGIANNKFVAKMSTSVNKPLGVTVTKPGEHARRFWDWPLISYFGIGAPTAEKLNKIGIKTIGDLAKANSNDVEGVLGIRSQYLIDQANGIGSDELNYDHNELKGIGNSKTFQSKDLVDRQEILTELSKLASIVSHRAEIRNMIGKVVSISIKKKGGKEIKAVRKQATLHRGISSYEDITAEAIRLFDMIWDESPIKFIGVAITKLEDIFETSYQASIFDAEKKYTESESIMKEINRKFKDKVVKSASELHLNIKKQANQSKYIESDRIIKHYDEEYRKK